jgi:hypothetical protein
MGNLSTRQPTPRPVTWRPGLGALDRDRSPPASTEPLGTGRNPIPIISSASPVVEEDRLFGLSKRRAILILGTFAAAVAVAAFVIVGALLGTDDSTRARPQAASARPMVDAGARLGIDAAPAASAASVAEGNDEPPAARKKVKRRKKPRARARERERDRKRPRRTRSTNRSR